MAAEIDKFLRFLVDHEGSDLMLASGSKPMARVHGDLLALDFGRDSSVLTTELTRNLVYEILNDEQIRRFERSGDLDFAYEVPECARFRCNVYKQTKGLGIVMRNIPTKIKTIEELGLPAGVKQLARSTRGFILVTGPTGSGKTTTLAAMIDLINHERHSHVVTIEEPIEYVHKNIRSLITQREVGLHTHSFKSALRSAVRQDPDIILVGEMRDLDTISMALTTAEMGALVFGTLHTTSAAKTINRIIDVFPFEERNRIRALLAEALTGVVAQQLVRRADKKGRLAVAEILVGTSAISNTIREGKIEQIPSLMETGKKHGMQMLDEHLTQLVQQCVITPSDARRLATNKALFS
ncbi:MAG: type IV pilus twitching motility protein PilT [Candidatus Abyssobacteria bacterium SURF_17]|uniref:Type IV pilus twitching motility protein PilT n=1 Tax=Candidatus Abyssobacteria bacterium SURF_17 TaxID=2093361 RepID=A0A419F6M5_9BACT|nr:MAG: type IV pilus twitching motility protein PilT [Candidatus Abyssubacteria bacterium SURF_17]